MTTLFASEPKDIFDSHLQKIESQRGFNAKWRAFEDLKKSLIESKSDSVVQTIYKNGVLDIASLFDRNDIRQKRCSRVRSQINMDYKVDSGSEVVRTDYFQDSIKLLNALCQ